MLGRWVPSERSHALLLPSLARSGRQRAGAVRGENSLDLEWGPCASPWERLSQARGWGPRAATPEPRACVTSSDDARLLGTKRQFSPPRERSGSAVWAGVGPLCPRDRLSARDWLSRAQCPLDLSGEESPIPPTAYQLGPPEKQHLWDL